ncbi:hypothetical protein JW948_19505 [bacterium]|nr:hypothetical protein [bacterium]
MIIGIHVQDRIHQVPDLQKVFTEYGCNIHTRLGLHEVNDANCSVAGLIILETAGPDAQIEKLIRALNQMDGIDVQKMVFGHE